MIFLDVSNILMFMFVFALVLLCFLTLTIRFTNRKSESGSWVWDLGLELREKDEGLCCVSVWARELSPHAPHPTFPCAPCQSIPRHSMHTNSTVNFVMDIHIHQHVYGVCIWVSYSSALLFPRGRMHKEYWDRTRISQQDHFFAFLLPLSRPIIGTWHFDCRQSNNKIIDSVFFLVRQISLRGQTMGEFSIIKYFVMCGMWDRRLRHDLRLSHPLFHSFHMWHLMGLSWVRESPMQLHGNEESEFRLYQTWYLDARRVCGFVWSRG
jgi:hypothetical protein